MVRGYQGIRLLLEDQLFQDEDESFQKQADSLSNSTALM